MLRLMYITLSFLLIFSAVYGKEFKTNFQVQTYEKAEKATNFIRFDMKSTKFGLITTSFTGLIKSFSISGNKENKIIKDLSVEIKINSMDTDIDGRNEKMWETCLDYKNHPNITVKFNNDVIIGLSKVVVPAIVNIRGVNKNISVVISSKVINNKITISGTSKVKLTELEVPNPSIIIASVNDVVNLSFNFTE